MANLGSKFGIIGSGSSIGGGGGISPPNGRGFRVKFTGEGGLDPDLHLISKASVNLTGEGGLDATAIDFKSISTNLTGEGGLDGELAAGFTLGKSLGLNGTNQYGTLATGITPNSTTTISLWFKANAFDSGNMFGAVGDASLSIRASSSTNIRYFSTAIKDFTVPTMTTGTKYHVVFTIDATNIRCYLNGVESSTGALAKPPARIIDQIGRYNTGASGFWYGGELNEIAFKTNGVATAGNVTSLYNSGNGADFLSVMGSADCYYQFNNSDGTDSSGNGNTLTLFNSPTFPTF